MKEIEKMQAGFGILLWRWRYFNDEVDAIDNANVFNSLAEDDLDKQHEVLSKILGSVGEKVWIAKRFCFDMAKTFSSATILLETSTWQYLTSKKSTLEIM